MNQCASSAALGDGSSRAAWDSPSTVVTAIPARLAIRRMEAGEDPDSATLRRAGEWLLEREIADVVGDWEWQRPGFGFIREEKGDQERIKDAVQKALKQAFRPEFLNRIDDIIIFHPLTHEQLSRIVDLQIALVQRQLAERKVKVELTEAAKAHLVKVGFDPVFGARPLKRAIQREVANPLSSKILAGEFGDGALVFSKAPVPAGA